jgi:hypothetical protein
MPCHLFAAKALTKFGNGAPHGLAPTSFAMIYSYFLYLFFEEGEPGGKISR